MKQPGMCQAPVLARLSLTLIGTLVLASCSHDDATAPEAPEAVPEGTLFIERLPAAVRAAVLWYADHEDGDLSDWEDAGTGTNTAGGGIFNTGGEAVTAALASGIAHSGAASLEATITGAWRAENGNRAVRAMRWTDRPWDEGGAYFPDAAYYSVWMRVSASYDPAKEPPWDPGDGGWWNVFQFKADNLAGVSVPIVVLDLWRNPETDAMELALIVKTYPDPYAEDHTQAWHGQSEPRPLQPGRWVHVEAFYRKSADGDGAVAVWQDGVPLFAVDGIVTRFDEQVSWGVGNYTDHVVGGPVPGTATIHFDDAIVATTRVSAALTTVAAR